MTYDHPENTIDKLRILADVELDAMRIRNGARGRDLRPAPAKCILFHLLAFEGKPISAQALRDRTGMGRPTISQAIQAFIRRGVLRARYTHTKGNKTRIFEFNWRKLQEMGRPLPLVGLSGTPGANMKRERVLAQNLLKSTPEAA